MKKILGILILSTFSLIAVANTADEHQCFPESELRFKKGFKSSGLQEYQFLDVIKKVERVFGPIIQNQFSKKLILIPQWDEDRVNAHATRDDDNNPVIKVNGGMARHPDMTEDGLTLIICHEIGHQFGGAPKKFRGRSERRSWSSAEGQADYFAATKCLPLLFSDEIENKKVVDRLPTPIQQKLGEHCHSDYCFRTALAGLHVARVFASLRMGQAAPEIGRRDDTEVIKTYYKHPTPQCRLDTYLSAANCHINPEVPFDNVDPKIGACFRNDIDNLVYSDGVRPLCWYRPQPEFR